MIRRLAAVLAADIVGYSKLMSEDETATLAALRDFRANSVHPFTTQHRGEIVKSMGDGWLISFASVQDAVSCAIKLQAALEEHEVIKLRIGVHTGDVTRQDEDIFGDGVNVAARLEAMAPTGGVALSDAAYAMLDGTLRPGFADQGEQALKNIDRPMRVWMRAPVGTSLTAAGMAKPKGFPRLIVKPIATTDTRDEVQDLAGELTADIALYLASVQWIETGVGYTLSQTLRARGDRLRLEVRLTSPEGAPIWSSKHDGDLADVFDWQDQTGEAVASEITGVILQAENTKLSHLDDVEMSAEQLLFKGIMSFTEASESNYVTSLHYMAAAIEKDPSLPLAYGHALVLCMTAHTLHYKSCAPYLAKIPEWVEASKPLIAQYPLLAVVVASLQYFNDFDETKLRPEIERALICSPFDLDMILWCGWNYVFIGEPLPALECFAKFLKLGRLSPYRVVSLGGAAIANIQAGRFEDALMFADQGLKRSQSFGPLYLNRAAALAHLGRLQEAQAAIQEVFRLEPDCTIKQILGVINYDRTPEGERYLEGLRLAGLPE
jgi:adenylate cyclase